MNTYFFLEYILIKGDHYGNKNQEKICIKKAS